MEIAMFCFFLITNLIVIGAVAFAYSGKEKYSEGMILGVHIPAAEADNEEVKKIGNRFKKNFKRINLWNLCISILLCLLCLWNISYFVMIWMLWLFVYIGLVIGIMYSFHRKMYDLKMKYHWVRESGSHMIHIDTVVTAMSDKLPVSHWISFGAVFGVGISFLLPSLRKYFLLSPGQLVFPGAILGAGVMFWLFHWWFNHRSNTVYSTDSSVNRAMNRMEKRSWSVIFLSAGYFNLLGWLYLAVKILKNQWLYGADYWIYIFLQMIPAMVIIFGVMYIQKRRKDILSLDTEAILVDDDEYWKNGWYSNPNDSHLLVPDRLCSTNYSMNMAKPAAKVISVVTGILVTVLIVGTFGLMLEFENVKIAFSIDNNQVSMKASLYHTSFMTDEIQSVELLDKLPEDNYIRTNGGDTAKYLIGHFSGMDTGKCIMYLYRNYAPILKIQLKDRIIYVNSKDKNEVKEWYEKLKEMNE